METSISQKTNQTQNYKLEFFGKGSDYFAIMIVNWLLTFFTLGLYYPWAKAKRLHYIHGQTALNNERFHFSGTGKEMFSGFIKIILLFIAIFGISVLIYFLSKNELLTVISFHLPIFAFVPIAIHGSLRYKMSRTSYRGIRFGYRGDRNEFAINFYKWAFLTIVTVGIYAAWMQMNIRKYTHQNIRYGDVAFSNDADGGKYFILNLKGYLLTIVTIGIYAFWWQAEIFNYYIDNMKMKKGDEEIKCYSTATGGKFFELLFVNLLIIVFTFGIGKAWADMRTQKFLCDNIMMEGNINLDEIHQTEEVYTDSVGESSLDFMDIDIN
ncbi:MAG: DUF898 domain-containing protein [Pseudarcicella sp.]|nr:DUF898 domain-containing protein [Pseudarcicella sp.]